MPAEPLLAALAIAREHGLPTKDPRILRDLTNLLVHLAPAPVVARVPLTLSRLRGRDWFAAELDLASFLAAAGAPVAPPTSDVDPGPHAHDGRLVTFWTLVDHDSDRFEPVAAGASLRDLHGALERYEGTLPRFDRLEEVGRLLGMLEPSALVSAEDLARLSAVHRALAREPVRDGRPLHGDAHFGTCSGRRTDRSGATSRTLAAARSSTTSPASPGATRPAQARRSAPTATDDDLVALVEPFLALFLVAWTVVVVERVPTDGGVKELRRRIDRACAYAREM